MNHLIKFLILLSIQVFTIQLFAEVSYNVRVVQTVNGSFLDMDIEIQSTGDPFVLSTSSFFLNYPTSPTRFSTPAKVEANDGPWDLNSDFDYANVLLSSDAGYLGLTLEFAGGIDNNGTVVPGSWTRIGTLRLTITDINQSSELTWRLIGSVTQVARLTSPGVNGGGSTSITSLGTFISPGDQPLPVELSSFTVSLIQNAINLKWQTKTEVNNYGFEVERRFILLDPQIGIWEKIGFVSGSGNSNSIKDYAFVDKNPSGGNKFIYRLKQIDNDGHFEYSDEVEIELIPNESDLFQNYPNPFNPITNIKFALQNSAKVNLSVYNLLGEKVVTLIDEFRDAGFYETQFDAGSLSTGVYVYRLTAGDFVQTKKMTLMK